MDRSVEYSHDYTQNLSCSTALLPGGLNISCHSNCCSKFVLGDVYVRPGREARDDLCYRVNYSRSMGVGPPRDVVFMHHILFLAMPQRKIDSSPMKASQLQFSFTAGNQFKASPLNLEISTPRKAD
jgi:hypothetical protein